MQLPTLQAVESNLRLCLLLKADDIYFTLAEPHGAAIRDDFLGVPVTGLADENLADEEIDAIDLERFSVARRVRELHAMLQMRSLSLRNENHPGSEDGRNDGADFVEHFLSTLPTVALGAVDMTGVRLGEVSQVYRLAYAWLNLIDTIVDAFDGKDTSALAVGDLALLSGLDIRTLRNLCGPKKMLRTSPTRSSLDRDGATPALVTVNGFDAIDWLRARKEFRISTIEPGWIERQLSDASGDAAITRGLLIAAVVNLGPLAVVAPEIDGTVQDARDWFDHGHALPPETAAKLRQHLGLNF